MKRVGVREFRDHATRYLAGDDVLAVERHGQPIGFYIPMGARRLSQREESGQELERLEQTIQSILAQTGMSRDELADLFDLSKPLPDSPRRHESVAAEAHATGR